MSPKIHRLRSRWRARHRFKPSLEVLEDRNLLTWVPVNPVLFGLNQPWTDGNSWLDFDSSPSTTTRGEANRDGVDRLAVRDFRYVGGTVTNFWDWETADWVSDAELQAFGDTLYQAQTGRRQAFQANGMAGPNGFYSPRAFHQFGQQAGFETIWVPNLATGQGGDETQIVAHAANLFNHLSTNGVPVRYVEMGNELSTADYVTRFTNSEDYLRNHAHPVSQRVRQLYPEAQIAVAGLFASPVWSHPSTYATEVSQLAERSRTWDSGLAANRLHGGINNFDAVVLHNYNMNAGALPSTPGPNNDNWKQALLAFPDAALRNAAVNIPSVYGSDVDLWITEFGINHSILTGTDPRTIWLNTEVTTNSTWDALYTAGYYLSGIEQNDTYKVMMRHPLAQMMRVVGPSGQRFVEINPTGQVLAHLFNLAEQSTSMDSFTIPNNPLLPVTVKGRSDLGVFQAVRFASPGTETWVILNRGNLDRPLSLPNDGGYTYAQRRVYRADASVVSGGWSTMPPGAGPWLMGTPMSVVHDESTLDPMGPVTFESPGYSLTFLTRTLGPPLTVESVVIDDGSVPLSTVSRFTAQFSQAIDPSVLNLYDSATAGLGLADVRVTGAVTGPVAGSLVVNPNNRTITFVATGGPLTPDTYTITFRSAANGFRTPVGFQLDGDNNGLPGGDHTAIFVVAPSAAVVVSVPDISRGPGQAVNVPASITGLPLRLSNGSDVQSISLTVRFDPALLRITGASVGASTPSDASVTLTPLESGLVRVEFSSPTTPLGVGPIDFVRLIADVLAGAPYGAKEVLDLGELRINGGAIASEDDDGLHVAAYLGDGTGNAGYSALDAARALRVAVGLDSGFGAFRLTDPRIIADINGDGRASSIDAARILQEGVGSDRPEIPPLPPNPPTIPPTGPDPFLNIGKFTGRPGDTILVSVNLDISDGLSSVDLALQYDTARLEVLSETDIQLGKLTGDFELFRANLDPVTGTIRVGIANLQAEGITGHGSGSLLQIAFRIKVGAPAGRTVINLLHDLSPTTTQLNEGGLVLNPVPSNEMGDVLDGVIVVRGSPLLTARRLDSKDSATVLFNTLVRFPSNPVNAVRFSELVEKPWRAWELETESVFANVRDEIGPDQHRFSIFFLDPQVLPPEDLDDIDNPGILFGSSRPIEDRDRVVAKHLLEFLEVL